MLAGCDWLTTDTFEASTGHYGIVVIRRSRQDLSLNDRRRHMAFPHNRQDRTHRLLDMRGRWNLAEGVNWP